MTDEFKFWMVWNPDGSQPRRRHYTREIADREARRLAEANPGQQFFVLKAMTGFAAVKPSVDEIKLTNEGDGIPF